jgi:hypothetical protein
MFKNIILIAFQLKCSSYKELIHIEASRWFPRRRIGHRCRGGHGDKYTRLLFTFSQTDIAL